MSIDKTGSGLPEIDTKRRTTKVNLAMMGGIVAFLIIAAMAFVWFAAR